MDMNDYMAGHIDACAKLAKNKAEFIKMVMKVTGLKSIDGEKYINDRAKEFKQ
jgi:hypothetical protein